MLGEGLITHNRAFYTPSGGRPYIDGDGEGPADWLLTYHVELGIGPLPISWMPADPVWHREICRIRPIQIERMVLKKERYICIFSHEIRRAA